MSAARSASVGRCAVSLLLAAASAAAAGPGPFSATNGVLAGDPYSVIPVPFKFACMVRCLHDVTCQAISYSDGQCSLFNGDCMVTLPAEDQPDTVSYKANATLGKTCPVFATPIGNKCFKKKRSTTPLTWEQAKAACLSLLPGCSRLARPITENIFQYLLYGLKRDAKGHWIDAADLHGDGALTLSDGTPLPWQPDILSEAAAGYIKLPADTTDKRVVRSGVDSVTDNYVCEVPLRCQATTPCPDGWHVYGALCYLGVLQMLTHAQANTHCGTLAPGGQLAHLHKTGDGMYYIWVTLTPSMTEELFVNLKWSPISPSWVALDGTPPAGEIRWKPGRPDDAWPVDKVAVATREGLQDQEAHATTRYFICQAPKNDC